MWSLLRIRLKDQFNHTLTETKKQTAIIQKPNEDNKVINKILVNRMNQWKHMGKTKSKENEQTENNVAIPLLHNGTT